MIWQIISGVIGMLIGFGLIVWSEQIVDMFGRFGWAEEHLGRASSYGFMKFLGIIVMILSLMFMTGDLYALIRWGAEGVKKLISM